MKLLRLMGLLFFTILLSSQYIYQVDPNTNLPQDGQKKVITNSELFDLKFESKYPKIAFVYNSFNAAAYNGFYTGYKYSTTLGRYGYPKLDAAQFFIRKPINNWSTSSPVSFINNLIQDGYPTEKISYISDEDVHYGNLYNNDGLPLYSTIIFVHNEYVTQDEYYNTIRFIKSGGNVIILNGNAFFAEVDYKEDTNDVYLVSGHAWDFDGENGTKPSTYYRYWDNGLSPEHFNFIGSRYCTFNKGTLTKANFVSETSNPHPIREKMISLGLESVGHNIPSHEENCLITPNYHEIANWEGNFFQPHRGIKMYEFFPYGPVGGSLIHLGLYGTDFIAYRSDIRKTILTMILHQDDQLLTPWIKYPMDKAVLNNNIILDYNTYLPVSVFLDGVNYPELKKGSSLDFLPEGKHNLTIIFDDIVKRISRTVIFSIDRTEPQFVFTYNESLPITDPRRGIPIKVEIVDENPEVLVYVIPTDIRKFEPGGGMVYHDGQIETTLDINTWDFDDFSLRVHGFDSAGNLNVQHFYFNTNLNNRVVKQQQPKLVRSSLNAFSVYIPKTPNAIATLQISSDFGDSWTRFPFLNYDADTQIATYSRNEDRLWYRVAIKVGGYTDYLQSIRSYQWDVNVPYISENNFTNSVKTGDTFEFRVNIDHYSEVRYQIELQQNSVVVDSSPISSFDALTQLTSYEIPDVNFGEYILLVKFLSNYLNSSFSFPIVINNQIMPTNIESITKIYNLMEGTKVTVYHELMEQTKYVELWSNGKKYDTIMSSKYASILVNNPNSSIFIVKEFDVENNLIQETTITMYLDPLIPSISGLSYFVAREHEEKIIEWIIRGETGGNYSFFINSELRNEGQWIDGDNFILETKYLSVGIYYLLLVARNNESKSSAFTTTLEILPEEIIFSDPTEISTTTTMISIPPITETVTVIHTSGSIITNSKTPMNGLVYIIFVNLILLHHRKKTRA